MVNIGSQQIICIFNQNVPVHLLLGDIDLHRGQLHFADPGQRLASPQIAALGCVYTLYPVLNTGIVSFFPKQSG